MAVKTESKLTLDGVKDYFQHERIRFLNQEETIAYVCWLLEIYRQTYGTELINVLKDAEATCHITLSDTVLYSALEWLLEQQIIVDEIQKMPGRGRPRRVYSINMAQEVSELARCWNLFLADKTDAFEASVNQYFAQRG